MNELQGGISLRVVVWTLVTDGGNSGLVVRVFGSEAKAYDALRADLKDAPEVDTYADYDLEELWATETDGGMAIIELHLVEIEQSR